MPVADLGIDGRGRHQARSQDFTLGPQIEAPSRVGNGEGISPSPADRGSGGAS